MNNGGVFTRNKVDTSLYILPNSAQTASTDFSLKLPAVPKGDCLASLAGWDIAGRERKKKNKKKGGQFHSSMSSGARRMWGRMRRVSYIPAPQQCKYRGCRMGGEEWGGMIELSHLRLHYRPVSKTLPPPLGLHLSCPSLKTSGFILEGQGQPSRKCRRRLR